MVLRVAGMICLVAGTSGVAWAICREQRERLEYLKTMKQIYEYLQNEIIYTRAALPEICRNLGERRIEPFNKAFTGIFEEVNKNNGCSLENIWEEQMTACTAKLPLKRNEKELLVGFPRSLGFRDGKGQAGELERYLTDISYYIKVSEEEIKNKNKVVMSMGIMGGIMMVILLL